jgi:hypothetical protein
MTAVFGIAAAVMVVIVVLLALPPSRSGSSPKMIPSHDPIMDVALTPPVAIAEVPAAHQRKLQDDIATWWAVEGEKSATIHRFPPRAAQTGRPANRLAAERKK